MTTKPRLPAPKMGRVPLGRRVLFGDRRRGVLIVAGVTTALLLVLILDAVFAGAMRQVTAYIRGTPAQLFISQQGVRTIHMSSSVLSPRDVAEASRVTGVEWAAPVSFTSGVLGSPTGRQLTYVFGYDVESGNGGPGQLVAGRPPGPGEVVIDEVAADLLRLPIGATATVLGKPLRVSGLASGGTSITNTTVFVTTEQFAALRGPTVSYILVRAREGTSPEELADALAGAVPGVTVQTKEQFVESETRIVSDMSADLMRLMTLIGLLIALIVIALGLLTTTLTRLREYAILKAIGATTGRLVGTVIGQALWIVLLAVVCATVLAEIVSLAIPVAAPTVQLAVTGDSILRVGLGALVAGIGASLLPLRRLAAIDPATAFREAT